MSDQATPTEEQLRSAVAEGMRAILEDDALMERLLDRLIRRLQRRAAENTGRWLWDSVKAVASRWIVIAAIVLFIAKVGGFGAAIQALRAMSGQPGH